MSSGESDDTLVRQVLVPRWMYRGAVGLIAILLVGPLGQLLINSQSIFSLKESDEQLSQRISANSQEIASIRTKQEDLIIMVNGLRKDITDGTKEVSGEVQSLQRKVDALTAKMP